jgi:hypothetical protein
VDHLKGLLARPDEERVAQGSTAPASNPKARQGRNPICIVISLIVAIGLSGCAANGEVGTGGQAVSTRHQVASHAGTASHHATAHAGSMGHQAAAHAGAASHQHAARARAARSQSGAASRDLRWVAGQFARFYAQLAANENYPASQAQVEALARQLAASCSRPRYGQYPCVVHLRGRVSTTQHCVAVVATSGSVSGRCSVGTAPAPVVASGYVDCRSIGRVVSVIDASGDEKRVVPSSSSVPLVPATDPHADLVEVRVAATSTRFCADLRTLAPLSHGSWLGLDITQNGAPDPAFSPAVNDRRFPAPELQSPINTPVAGQIGTSGDWTSLVIAAGNTSAPLPRRPFQFRAYANHETFASGVVRLTTDSAPDTPRYATYR